MKVRILFNNEAMAGGFSTGWGLSCLVDECILFDTGESEEYLLNNMKIMGVDIECIKAVVVSHDHWDHTGGLWGLMKRKKGLKVYSCPRFSDAFKEKIKSLNGVLIEASGFKDVTEDVFITGEIAGTYTGRYMPEQALIAKTKNGINVITGCAHPGIIEMVEKARDQFPNARLYSVLGGFHLMDKDKRAIKSIVDRFRGMGVRKAGPTHCSGKEAEEIFKARYGGDFISVTAGQTLEL